MDNKTEKEEHNVQRQPNTGSMKSKIHTFYSLIGTRNTAYTLIELLISIAIIVILMGMLLPMLSKVKERTYAISCLNNQKQLGVASTMYAETFSGFIPPTYWNGYWPTKLIIGMDKPGEWLGATTNGFNGKTQNSTRALFRCPSAKEEENFYGLSYRYLSILGFYLPGSGWVYPANDMYHPRLLFRAPKASNLMLLADGLSENFYFGFWVPSDASLRHCGSANILYLDGHCAPTKLLTSELVIGYYKF